MIRVHIGMLVASLLCVAVAGCATSHRRATPAADFGAAVREFAAKRYTLAMDLSRRLNLPLPHEAETFFSVATTGIWESVSNQFDQVKQQPDYGTAIVELRNELWAPIHETMGIWEVWVRWKGDSSLLALFHEPILASMPKGSIYFGGTDCGRFVITTMNALQASPPVFCITQNAVADSTYAAHLRAVYGKQIWLPQETDSNHAFQQYVDEVRSGKRADNSQIKIADGRVHISGVLGVMELNGILCKMIFEHNKDSHEFFVEESYVLAWMYPHLEPHGLIMKLNPQPIGMLSTGTVASDREFWGRYERLLESQPGFASNVEARKAFSKLRSAIAGIYVYRKMYAEAEDAFQQAIRLFDASPEASFRLAKMYEEQKRLPEAITTMAAYLKFAQPDSREKAEEYIKQLNAQRQNNGADPIR